MIKSKFLLLLFISTLFGRFASAQKSDDFSVDVKYAYCFSDAGIALLKGDESQAMLMYYKCLSINNKASAPDFQISRIYYEQNNFDMALKFAQSAVNKQSDNVWYSFFLSDLYVSVNLYSDACRVLEKVINDYNLELYYSKLADIYFKAEFYEKLVSLYTRLEQIKGFDSDISLRKYDVLMLRHNYSEAEKVLLNIISFYPDNLNFLGTLCEFYFKTGQLSKVRPILDDMLQIDSDNGLTYLTYAYLCISQHNISCFFDCLTKAFNSDYLDLERKLSIISDLDKTPDFNSFPDNSIDSLYDILISKYPDSCSVHSLYASYLLNQQLYDKAADELKTVLEISPSDYSNWKLLISLYVETEDYISLAEIVDKASEYFPEQLEVILYQGVASLYTDNFKQAASYFDVAYSYGVDMSELAYLYYYYTGVLLYKTGKTAEAFVEFDKFYNSCKTDYKLNSGYVWYCADAGINTNSALTIIKSCVASDVDNAYYYYVYAYLLWKLKDYQSAVYFIDKSLTINRDCSAAVYETAGDIYFSINDFAKAIDCYSESLNRGGIIISLNNKIKQCN